MDYKEKNDTTLFSRQIAEKENRKLKALHEEEDSVWSGLGVFGMVGWSVVVPALLGIAMGIWLDKKHPESFSWTLTLLISGLAIGCVIAWTWVTKEDKSMDQK